ncbi:hypothetical protein AN639_09605 [Candidatus Epulonipiscium fishelsonii]|uniref:Uncharacterized protein n=1 Tax=Candidatus Epulonipiscium fishelsonii TaxID=77094 RepID=A0ACC8XGE4_9FIRM|nr:hypothetical protein AN639_09605 [Epulopiscium sp. SCG-B05WGA-EpuloA1]ONI42575.1 hypothetical protein AN396_14040 [Epulopiscium sp. SCG-B11WGA-EpuloA1]
MENNLIKQLDLLEDLVQSILSKQSFTIFLVSKILTISLQIYVQISSILTIQNSSQIAEVFTELTKAIENEDYILIEDLLEYELIDIIKQCKICITNDSFSHVVPKSVIMNKEPSYGV